MTMRLEESSLDRAALCSRVFIAGVAVGSRSIASRVGGGAAAQDRCLRGHVTCADRLELTARQRAQADSIVQLAAPTTERTMLDVADRLRVVSGLARRGLRAILTPQQRARWTHCAASGRSCSSAKRWAPEVRRRHRIPPRRDTARDNPSTSTYHLPPLTVHTAPPVCKREASSPPRTRHHEIRGSLFALLLIAACTASVSVGAQPAALKQDIDSLHRAMVAASGRTPRRSRASIRTTRASWAWAAARRDAMKWRVYWASSPERRRVDAGGARSRRRPRRRRGCGDARPLGTGRSPIHHRLRRNPQAWR